MKIEPTEMSDIPESEDSDHESLMDQCAMECMNAIEKKEKTAFQDSFEALVADLLTKMQKE